MQKVYIDTNVILDVLLDRREFLDDSMWILDLCTKGKLEGFITSNNLSDIYYFTKKYTKSEIKSRKAIEYLISFLKIVPISIVDVYSSLNIDNGDYEDAISISICEDEKADWIITRNVKDFTNTNIKVITPEEFKKLKLEF